MRFLPFEDFEIHTTMTSSEVFYRLRFAVETKETWRILISKPYFGKVRRGNFRISRVTAWWNRNHPPVFSGKIQSEDSGSCVQIKARLHWYGFVFWTVWLGGVWFMFFGGITNLILQKIQTGVWQIDSPVWLLPYIGMFAFGYLLEMGSFKVETKRSKEFLLKLLETGWENVKFKNDIIGLTESQIIKSLFLVTGIASLGWIMISLIRWYFIP